jgi:hypothetical protein
MMNHGSAFGVLLERDKSGSFLTLVQCKFITCMETADKQFSLSTLAKHVFITNVRGR